MRLGFALPALQFPLNGLPEDVGDLLTLRQRGLDAVLGPLWESGRDLFEIYLRSAHFS